MHAHGHSHAHPHPAPLSHVPPEHARLMRLATTASIVMAVGLVIAKLVAWWVSDSLAMLSSVTDSLFDVVTSAINFLAVRYALKPADEDHRYGHTGIEDIAGAAQFMLIVGAMLVILMQSVERLFHPEPLQHEIWGIGVSALAMLATAALVVFQSFVVKKTGSLVVASDRMHYASDILFNLGVLLAFACSLVFGVSWADPAFAIVIALVVLWSTHEIGLRAFHNLMNREMPEAELARIRTALAGMDSIRGYRDLRTRNLGTKAIIQLEVDVAKALPFEEAHRISHEVQDALAELFPYAEVLVHPNPV